MKQLILVCALTVLAATTAAAQPSINIGPGGISVDSDRRDRVRDRRGREEQDVRTTGSTRRCKTVVQERQNSRGEMVERRIRECD